MDIGKELAKAFDYGYEQGKKDATQWISINDRLPDAKYGESDSVLTISESGIQEVLYFDGSCWCHPTGEVRESVFHITHWMPLPEPPEGE